MSLMNTMKSGASGLTAIGTSLGVIGDNIANINTTGFKSSRANFADIMPQFIGSASGGGNVGRGTGIQSIATNFSQGALINTGSALDVGITGEGWFQVSNGADTLYTRDGSFNLDKDNRIVNGAGLQLQGYQAVDGVVTSTVGDLTLDLGSMAPVASSAVTLDANLNPDIDPAALDLSAFALDGTESMGTVSAEADYSTSVTIYDSLGRPHDLTVMFDKVAGTNNWEWHAVVDAGEMDADGDGVADTANAGNALELMSGTVSFDTTGQITGYTETAAAVAATFPGADPTALSLDMGWDLAAGAPGGAGELTSIGSSSFVNAISQDGVPPGAVSGVRVAADGSVMVDFDNGEERLAGQLALATFAAEGGLEGVGGNLFRATMASGDPALGRVGEGGRGQTIAYALEGSNVSLEDQFVQMIQAQRAYQANAGTVRTADETLQELVNLV